MAGSRRWHSTLGLMAALQEDNGAAPAPLLATLPETSQEGAHEQRPSEQREGHDARS